MPMTDAQYGRVRRIVDRAIALSARMQQEGVSRRTAEMARIEMLQAAADKTKGEAANVLDRMAENARKRMEES